MTDEATAAARRAAFERMLDAMNTKNVEGMKAAFADELEFIDDAAPEPITSHAQMAHFMEVIHRSSSNIRFELVEGPYLSDDGRVAVARVRVSGTMDGPFDPPGFAPTGGRIDIEYAGFYEYEGDRVKRGRIIMNMGDLARQMGAAPEPGTPAARMGLRIQRLTAARMRRRAGKGR